MDQGFYLGLVGLILVAVVGAYLAGKAYAKVKFEAKGHEEIEKHLIRKQEQVDAIAKKYDKLRTRFSPRVRNGPGSSPLS